MCRILLVTEQYREMMPRQRIAIDHQSVRITEKHYAPWVRSRQEELEADLTNSWKNDPLISTSGEVRGRDTRNGLTLTSSFHSHNFGGARGNGTHPHRS